VRCLQQYPHFSLPFSCCYPILSYPN
jgi:hypothetical protein